MLCPHCQSEIAITIETEHCPFCKTDIKLDVKSALAAEECVRSVLTEKDVNEIIRLLAEGKRVEAMRTVRKIRGKMEPFVEARVLKIIEQGSTDRYSLSQNYEKGHNSQVPIHLVPCIACNKLISAQAETCVHCGHPTGVHVCPRCGSTNTKTISSIGKATSVLLWGVFATNKVVSKFECKHCGHKW